MLFSPNSIAALVDMRGVCLLITVSFLLLLVRCVLALLVVACFTPFLPLLWTKQDLHLNRDKICTQTATAQGGFDPKIGPNSMHNPNSRL